MIEVWHASAEKAFSTDTTKEDCAKVAEIGTFDLDAAYAMTQNLTQAGWPALHDGWTFRVFGGTRQRSTSVGDIMIRDGLAYRVANCGFDRIGMDNSRE